MGGHGKEKLLEKLRVSLVDRAAPDYQLPSLSPSADAQKISFGAIALGQGPAYAGPRCVVLRDICSQVAFTWRCMPHRLPSREAAAVHLGHWSDRHRVRKPCAALVGLFGVSFMAGGFISTQPKLVYRASPVARAHLILCLGALSTEVDAHP